MQALRVFITLFSLLLMTLHITGQSVPKWSVNELSYQGNKVAEPFAVSLQAIFTHQDGAELVVPGFYNGGKQWMVRYSLPMEGTWDYQITSDLKKFDGKKGSITVGPARTNQKGPITIEESDPTHFYYADGDHYNLMAYELDWLFALDWNNQEDIPNTRQIIKSIKENGFNQVVMNVYAYDASWGDRESVDPRHNFAKPEFFPYGGSNDSPDYTTLNVDFFKHLDRVIQHLNHEQVVSHLMIYVWNKQVNWPEPNSAADDLYFDYVVKRYQAFPNLIWDISKEALAYGRDDMGYITNRIDRLRDLDGHQRLLSVHDYAYCKAFPETVDFISTQDWVPNLYNAMLEVASNHPQQPIFNIEHGGYETTLHKIFNGAYSDPLTCLERNYLCAFAGVYSTYYWQNSSWYEVIYDLEELPDDSQPNLSWYNNFISLFNKYQFHTLTPVQYNSTTYGLHNGKNVVLFFVPGNMDVLSGNVPFFKNKKASIQWFDPLTGITHPGESRDFGNGTWMGFRVSNQIEAPFSIAIIEYEDL